MASTSKTPHLGLCQWEATDPFLREDMNGDFAKIDEAVGSRLKLELLRDLELNTHNMNQLELDVSDIDIGSYMVFIMDFLHTQTCVIKFNTNDVAGAPNLARLFFLPFKDPESYVHFVRLVETNLTVGYRRINYLNVEKINLVCSDTFTDITKLRIWGVK